MNCMKRVLVVVAHPDDEVLGCGATIRKLVEGGAVVRVLVVGEGSSCRHPADRLASAEVQAEIVQRRTFADAAMQVLGVTDAVFCDFPCGRFDTAPVIDIGKLVETHIADFKPDTLMTHYGEDANSDHRVTFNAVIAATRPTPSAHVRTVLCFETPSSTEWRFVETFRPNLFIEVGRQMEAKVAAFDCYLETEGRPFPFPRCKEGLLTLSRYRGMQVGVEHAEAFLVVRSVLADV
jgi:LmbE family N-acetylglucosaminyl deacetylase